METEAWHELDRSKNAHRRSQQVHRYHLWRYVRLLPHRRAERYLLGVSAQGGGARAGARHTYIPYRRRPVAEYLQTQRRFQDLFSPRRQEEILHEIQAALDGYWCQVALKESPSATASKFSSSTQSATGILTGVISAFDIVRKLRRTS